MVMRVLARNLEHHHHQSSCCYLSSVEKQQHQDISRGICLVPGCYLSDKFLPTQSCSRGVCVRGRVPQCLPPLSLYYTIDSTTVSLGRDQLHTKQEAIPL